VNYGNLEIEITLDDPKAYTAALDGDATSIHRSEHGTAGIFLPGEREGPDAFAGKWADSDSLE
jgi:hypothetical protein